MIKLFKRKNSKENKVKIQLLTEVISINMKNEILIKASSDFNLNVKHYLNVLKVKGIQNNDIQILRTLKKWTWIEFIKDQQNLQNLLLEEIDFLDFSEMNIIYT